MTDKYTTSSFNIESIRKMTDKRNTFKIDLKMTSFYYPGYSAFPDSYEYEFTDEFENLMDNFASIFRSRVFYLLKGVYERYIASNLDEDYTDLMLDPTLYENHFEIVVPNRLSYALYSKDILYVYDDDKFLVATSPIAIKKFRELRGIK